MKHLFVIDLTEDASQILVREVDWQGNQAKTSRRYMVEDGIKGWDFQRSVWRLTYVALAGWMAAAFGWAMFFMERSMP